MNRDSWWNLPIPGRQHNGSAQLLIRVDKRGDLRVISVRGRLDVDSSPQLLAEIRRALRGARRVELDLSEVRYVDSSGISILILGLKMAQERGAQFVLTDPSAKVMAVIELSQLHRFFTIETTRDPA